jgi:(3,5-dihydroxyphenyl)acetyl-CoA 1,2-dioxygenase
VTVTAPISAPVLGGGFTADRKIAGDFYAEIDQRLAGLPTRAQRDGDAEEVARTLHEQARRVRTRFLRLHAEPVYDELADGRGAELPPGLAELAWRASEAFPGLAPSRAQMADEARYGQRDREGREIDQGILFGGLLAAPRPGRDLMRSMLRPTPRGLELLEVFQRTGEVVLTAARLDRRDRAGHVTITNTHCLNAEDNQHVADLEALVDVVLLDPGIRVGVLRGGVMTHPRYAGRRVFSAGINLKELQAGRISFVDFLLRRELGYLSKMMRGMLTETTWSSPFTQKPWLAAVDTFAIGGGAQILLACDRVIAAGDAYFSLPAAREGIVPGVSNLRLTRFVGARPARQIILGGRKVWAKESAAQLVFDEVVEPAAMDAAVDAAAAELDNPAVVANRRMLNLAEEPQDALRGYLAEFAVQQALRAYGQDVLARLPG